MTLHFRKSPAHTTSQHQAITAKSVPLSRRSVGLSRCGVNKNRYVLGQYILHIFVSVKRLQKIDRKLREFGDERTCQRR